MRLPRWLNWAAPAGRLTSSGWALVTLAYLLLYLAWWGWALPPQPVSDLWRWAVSHLAPVPVGLLAARAILRRPALATQLPVHARRAWMFLGLAALMWVAGGALWLAVRLATGARPPLPSLGDPVYMAGHLLALAALLSYPLFPTGRFDRSRVLLDLAIVAGVALTLGWLLLIQPIFSSLGLSLGEALWTSVYPALDLAMWVMLLMLFVVRQPRDTQPDLRFVAAALVALSVADLAYTFLGLRGQSEPVLLFDLGRVAGLALLGLGALQPPRGAAQWPFPGWRRRVQAGLPLAAGLALAWYVYNGWQRTGQVEPAALWVTVLLAVAVVARQGLVAGESELRQYAQLVDSAADPAFICTARGEVVLANPAFYAALGLSTANPAAARTLFEVVQPEARPPDLFFPTQAFTPPVLEEGWSGEVALRRSDGSAFPVYLSLRPVADEVSARPVLAGTAHDLSVLKRQQNALVAAYEAASAARRAVEDLNQQLEVRVAEKTRNLSEAYAQLERQNEELKTLDQLKSDFVSMVSHELRAPLTNIAGGMELALLRSAELAPRTQAHLLTVQAEIRRLSRFVETILDLSALEAGRLPVTLAPLAVAEALAPLQAQWAATPAGARVVVAPAAPGLAVLADARALTSVLFHLVDNALKYAPDGPVTVAAVAEGAGVWISVSDRGPGIPEAQREVIFERFQRLNAADSQAVYGHGLGLYMVRRLLWAMNSEIQVSEAPGGGARFAFSLPSVVDEG